MERTVDGGGLTNVGVRIHTEHPGLKIGTIVAGNSGRPGGACGLSRRIERTVGGEVDVSWRGQAQSLHPRHTTQEEDVVSNWFLTSAHDAGVSESDEVLRHGTDLYRDRLHKRWGMDVPDRDSLTTKQGVNYTTTTAEADYGDAWVVDDVRLSRKDVGGATPTFDFAQQYPTSLFFVAAPNAGACGRGPTSTTRRTYNSHAAEDYDFFRRGLMASLRAGLLAMAARGCDVALLPGVGLGLYAGPHRERIQAEFEAAVNEVLGEPMNDGRCADPPRYLGDCFRRVIWTELS